MGETKDAAHNDVEYTNGDQTNIVAHKLEDSLRVGIDSAGQSAGTVLRAVKELQVLPENVSQTLASHLVSQSLHLN